MVPQHPTFWAAITHALSMFDAEQKVHTERWQGVDISKNPAAAMHEVLHYSFRTEMPTEDLDHYRQDIRPNLPWADDHFLERVCGEPLNPGVQHANWPFAFHGKKALAEGNGEQYSHSYMERLWPKHAGFTPGGKLDQLGTHDLPTHRGVRHEYGDLMDLVKLLAEEPDTRQAYIPMFFPEDTGTVHRMRKPCSLGWGFIMRNGKLDVTYYIRSCDFYRHLQDDIYMTVRLALWVLDRARELNPEVWGSVKPGTYLMSITSLHMFVNDLKMIQKKGLNGVMIQ